MKKINDVRLTLAAFIFAIEQDLRLIIQKHVIPHYENTNFINSDISKETILRFNKQNPELDPNKNLDMIVDFLDFQDNSRLFW